MRRSRLRDPSHLVAAVGSIIISCTEADSPGETTETPIVTAPKDTLGMTEVMHLLIEDQQARKSELFEQML